MSTDKKISFHFEAIWENKEPSLEPLIIYYIFIVHGWKFKVPILRAPMSRAFIVQWNGRNKNSFMIAK